MRLVWWVMMWLKARTRHLKCTSRDSICRCVCFFVAYFFVVHSLSPSQIIQFFLVTLCLFLMARGIFYFSIGLTNTSTKTVCCERAKYSRNKCTRGLVCGFDRKTRQHKTMSLKRPMMSIIDVDKQQFSFVLWTTTLMFCCWISIGILSPWRARNVGNNGNSVDCFHSYA